MTTILPWLTNTEDVIGTADELGKDCKKLDKLYDHCWQIAGYELIHENDNGCIYLCENAEGMLVPNPASGSIEVYLKFVTKRHRYPSSMIAVKVGYLPENSVFKDITRPTVVRLRCCDTHYDLLGRHFEVKIVIAPRKLSSEEYYENAVEEDLSQKKHALSRRQGVFLYAMKDDEAGLGYMVNAAHDLCRFDMACMIGKERPQGGLDPIK